MKRRAQRQRGSVSRGTQHLCSLTFISRQPPSPPPPVFYPILKPGCLFPLYSLKLVQKSNPPELKPKRKNQKKNFKKGGRGSQSVGSMANNNQSVGLSLAAWETLHSLNGNSGVIFYQICHRHQGFGSSK